MDSNTPAPRVNWRRWFILACKVAVAVALLWGVERTAVNAYRELATRGWSFAQLHVGWLLLSALLYALGQLPSGLFWHRVLHQLGQRPPLWDTLRAFYIGHLGKYVPGKAMVLVLRAGLLRRMGVDPLIAAASIFYETLTLMSVGAALGGALLAIAFRNYLHLLPIVVGMSVVAGLPTLPPVFAWIMRITRVDRGNAAIRESIERLRYDTLIYGWTTLTGAWCVTGMSLWAAVMASGASQGNHLAYDWLLCTAAAALAVVAGFLSFLPGGLLVREAVILGLLAPTYGEATALVAAVLARLNWLVAEALVSVILYALGGSREPPGSDASLAAPSPPT